MSYGELLDISSSWAAILTAVVATWAYGQFVWKKRTRRKRLEDHLKNEKLMDRDMGRRTVAHLMAYLAMTEAEVLQAGFESKLIEATPSRDENGRADGIFFEYAGSDIPKRKKF